MWCKKINKLVFTEVNLKGDQYDIVNKVSQLQKEIWRWEERRGGNLPALWK